MSDRSVPSGLPAPSAPQPTPLAWAPPRAGAEELIWFQGSLLTVKATGETTGGAFDMVEQLIAPGFSPPLHTHHREEESFYVLEGQMTFFCGDQTFAAGPGAFVVLPRGVPHTFRVEGTEPAHALEVNFPAGLVGFFRDLGTPAPSRMLPPPGQPEPSKADIARMFHISNLYGMDILPPPGA